VRLWQPPRGDVNTIFANRRFELQNRRQLSAAPFLHGHYKTKLTANSCIARSSSSNAVSFSSALTMKRFL